MNNKKLFDYILKTALNIYQVARFKINYDRKSIIVKHVKKNQPSKILEIGVHTGGFATRMLSQLTKNNLANTFYTGIDLFAEMQTPQNHAVEISMWPGSKINVLKNIKKAAPNANINLIQSSSHDYLIKDNNKYDLIFIDGGHSYKTVKADWELSSKLLNDEGVIFFDDFTSENGALKSGFGIRKVIEEIDITVWKVKVFSNTDLFKKNWGILALKIVRVNRI